MNIAYDVKVDALYITLIPGNHKVQTQHIDEDIALDFDEPDRLVGIEVLDASRRLELNSLFPIRVSNSSDSSESSAQTSGVRRDRSK